MQQDDNLPAPVNSRRDLATPVVPATDRVRETAEQTLNRHYAESVASALRIDESPFIVLDDREQIERKLMTQEQALAFASDRVERVGGIHVIYKRVGVVRVPRPVVEIEQDP